MAQQLFPRFPAEIVQRNYSSTQALESFKGQVQQTKKLFSPTVQLSGSHASLLTCKVSSDGTMLATGGFDKQVYLWDIYDECKNFSVLKGHTNAILEAQWSTDSCLLFTASADKTLAVWDVETLKRIKKCNHQAFVNSCYPVRRGPDYVCTAVDDGNNIVWDLRAKNFVMNFQNKYASTSISFNDTADKVYSAGIDNQIKVFDLRKREIDNDSTLLGHTDTITGIALSHDGSYLLSNSMDLTIRCWDVRPFVTGKRCVKIFQGASHNFEKNLLRVAWSADGNYISSGSSDKFTYIWDTTTRRVVARLPGHNGSVNETSFSPTDGLIASASSDQTAIIGVYEANI